MKTRTSRQPSSLFGAVALMVGTAVGAGIFALPYVFSRAGVLVGLGYVLGLGSVLALVNLAYGEVVLSTEGDHQLVAYVERYLGQRWKIVALLATCVGFYGALSAYAVEVSNLLYGLLGDWLPFTRLQLGLVYFTLVSCALGIGLRAVTVIEKMMMLIMLTLVVSLIVLGLPHVVTSNYQLVNPAGLFLPYGVVLFALAAASAVPDMKNVLRQRLSGLKQAILIGSIVPIVIYAIFATVAVGITGSGTTESAVAGLGQVLGPWALLIGSLFGCVTMTTSFLVLGLVLREVYQFDFHMRPTLAWAATIIPPLLMLIFNWLSFIEILGISGALVGGLEGIMIMQMHRRLRIVHHRPSEFTVTQSRILHVLTYLIFIGGIAYEGWVVVQRLS
ncbi:MAG: hypothetical protein HY565_01495 [Candidatus Kerfeldbacteria bacterium]|nr:hypothetical protein [Candidatus Kerfeldbacteria bacterium]